MKPGTTMVERDTLRDWIFRGTVAVIEVGDETVWAVDELGHRYGSKLPDCGCGWGDLCDADPCEQCEVGEQKSVAVLLGGWGRVG